MIALMGVFAVIWDQSPTTHRLQGEDQQNEAAVDTFIPAGFVLVPISVSNFESLDSILGQQGVVDLYSSPASEGGRPVRVARHIKILRAPLNPSNFAVLAPEEESANLVKHHGPFSVVVQNPKQLGTDFERVAQSKAGRTKVSRITVEQMNEKVE